MTKILLVNPQISGERRYGKYAAVGSYQPPYGLLTIASVLEKNDFLVKIIDADSRKGISLEDILRLSGEFDPDIIGLTAYSINADHLVTTAKELKEQSGVPVIVGGPHVISFPEDLERHEFIDLLCTGEGELAALEVMEAIRDNKGFANIAGISYRNGQEFIRNSQRELLADLDRLPYPAFHLLDELKAYAPTPLMYKQLPILMLTTSRGCPYSCIFCNSIWGKRYRCNSAEYVVDMIEENVARYGFREVMFYEDTFCLKKERVLRICELLQQKDMGLSWSCSSHVNHLTKEMLLEMKKAGCWIISVGIESGNQEVLNFIKKSSKLERIREVAGWASEVGIKVRGFFILGHPVDNKQTIRQTIDFAKSLPLFTVNFTILQLLPGSEVREIAHEYGTVNYDLSLGTGHPEDNLSFVPKGLTEKYLKRMQARAYFEFFFRPRQLLQMLKMLRSKEDVKKYARLFFAFVKLVLSGRFV